MENEDGLISEWGQLSRACRRHERRNQWDNELLISNRNLKKVERYKERLRRDAIEGPVGVEGTTIWMNGQANMYMIRELQIAQARRDI